jgi:hypothetical protein
MGRTLLIHHAFKTHPERKHQMVSTRDIGIAGARAFEEPGRWKVLDLAGDEIDMVELQQTYREVMGEEVDTPLGLRLVTGMGRRFIGTPRGVADVSTRPFTRGTPHAEADVGSSLTRLGTTSTFLCAGKISRRLRRSGSSLSGTSRRQGSWRFSSQVHRYPVSREGYARGSARSTAYAATLTLI